MRQITRTALRGIVASLCSLLCSVPAAMAHVKWFLGKSESEILKLPKPELFNSLCLANLVPMLLAIVALFVTTLAGRVFSRWSGNRLMIDLAMRKEAQINLFIGVCSGLFLIYCGCSRILLAPNFLICEHCPHWLPAAEALVGCSLLFGFLARLGAVGLLALLSFTFMKHPFADCLDLLPMYGIALYFLLSARNRFSVDFWLISNQVASPRLTNLAHLLLRWFAGVGLMIVALDEKLLHPQLAMELIKVQPSLNFVGAHVLPNEMFVLCAGLSELLLGLIVVVGSFPRLAALMLLGAFVATTQIFGTAELLGHLPFYGIICSLLFRGSGPLSAFVVIQQASCEILTVKGRRPSETLA